MNSNEFENKVKKTIRDFRLLNKKDKVLVAASGGKDSTTVLYILNKLGYNVTAIVIDLAIGSYSKQNIKNLKKFCRQHDIPLKIISFSEKFGYSLCGIKMLLASKGIKMNSCSVCGVLRRYLLNKVVRKYKATKVVTGHNLDDEAESIMMNFFRNTLELSSRLGPVTGSIASKKFVPRVKPLYFCLEKYIERYSRKMNFPVVYDPCPCRNESFRFCVLQYLDDQGETAKENIAKQFLKLLPKLKKKYAKGELMYCSLCGEPSKHNICQTCQILGKLIK